MLTIKPEPAPHSKTMLGKLRLMIELGLDQIRWEVLERNSLKCHFQACGDCGSNIYYIAGFVGDDRTVGQKSKGKLDGVPLGIIL